MPQNHKTGTAGNQVPAVLDAALLYAKAGMEVFPCHSIKAGRCTCGKADCKSPGKHPRIPNGHLKATTDELQIRRWFKQYPDANIAWRPGEDFCVIDADEGARTNSKGVTTMKVGLTTLKILEATHGPLGRTMLQRSGGGGLHIVCRQPAGVKVADKPAKDIEVKSHSGYILVEPSNHLSGNRYRWEDNALANLGMLLDLVPDVPGWAHRADAANDNQSGERLDMPWLIFVSAVMAVRNDFADRKSWFEFGCGIHHQSEGSEEGRALFQAWSELWKVGNDSDYNDTTWNSMKDHADGKNITGATVIALAKKAGWVDPREEPVEDTFEDGPAPGPKPKVTKTEAMLADVFAEKYKDVLRYNTDSKRWHEWTGTHWQPETTGLAYDYAVTVCRPAVGGKLAARTRALSATASSVERIVKAHRAFVVKAEHFDSDPWLLGTPGGTVDLRTGALRASKPGEYISKLTVVAPGGDCPQWKKFLRIALGSDDMVRFAQRWFGYCLTGDTREEKFVFGYGPGGAGKGSTIETLVHTLGDYAANIPIEALTEQKFGHGHTTELASLQGARFVWSSETDPQAYWDQQRVTSLTGGEKIKARLLYENPVEFKPGFKITVVGNHAPRLRNVDTAIRRRLFVLPFDHPPKKPDLTLKARLKGEAPGILSWMIAGCRDWQENGLVIPQGVEAASEEYLGSEDDFTEWLETNFDRDPNGVVATSVLWASWTASCILKDLNPGSLTRTFPREMKKRGFKPANLAGHVKGWSGLAAKLI